MEMEYCGRVCNWNGSGSARLESDALIALGRVAEDSENDLGLGRGVIASRIPFAEPAPKLGRTPAFFRVSLEVLAAKR
jgi:hypothetical protein